MRLYSHGKSVSTERSWPHRIVVVEGGSELKEFIDLPWNLYAGYPDGFLPLRRRSTAAGSPPAPFLSSAERGFFWPARFAAVGRIAASSIDAINEFHGERMGIWDSSNALTIGGSRSPLSAVETWARRKGMAFVRDR